MSGASPGSLVRAKAALESDLLRTSLELRRASEEYAALEAAFRLSAQRLREAGDSVSALRDEAGGVRRAAAALAADRDELRRVTASLREERTTLRAELEAARAETANLGSDLARTRRERDDANARLAEVYATRAWRLANLYWRTLRRLGLLPASPEAANAPMPPSKPVAAPLPPASASDVAVPEGPAQEGLATEDRATQGLAPAEPVEDDPIPAPRAIPGPPSPVEPPRRTFGALRDEAAPGLPDIVCFSIVEWEFLFQRPQQLLSRLADRGHRVWYVSQFFEPVPGAPTVHRLRSRVSALRLCGSARHLFSEELPADEAEAVFASLSSLRDAEGIASAVSFVHQPFWWPLAERARRAFGWKVLYDCMDDHAGFQTNARPVEGPERGILEDADAVVTTARALEGRLRTAGRPVALVPNGCDFEYFASIAPRARGGRPTVGYYGCIADWFDSDLVADVAAKRPDWDFVLIGPTYLADLTRLPALPNVTFPGLVPYGQLLERLDRFDAFLLPFRRSPLTDAANPVKAYEIMATGRPLVSVPLPELEPFGDLVRFAGDAAELERQLEVALAEDDPALEARRRDFARRNSWDARAEVFERLVASLGGRSVPGAARAPGPGNV
ncbi:MAG: glycosyltransferase [Thermoanaerobaculia bacterium]|nr:glycosyltransferase [Thermoanaerobaculia bacterium]